MSFNSMAAANQSKKRKMMGEDADYSTLDTIPFDSVKRIHIPAEITTPSMSEASTATSSLLPTPAEDCPMDEFSTECMLQQPSFTKPALKTAAGTAMNTRDTLSPIARPSTPPLGMTLSHYDTSTGSYTSSQISSNFEVRSPICTGMTPVYRPPFDRWGSCLI